MRLTFLCFFEVVEPFVSMEIKRLFRAIDIDYRNWRPISVEEIVLFLKKALDFIDVKVKVGIVSWSIDFIYVFRVMLHKFAHGFGYKSTDESSKQESDD